MEDAYENAGTEENAERSRILGTALPSNKPNRKEYHAEKYSTSIPILQRDDGDSMSFLGLHFIQYLFFHFFLCQKRRLQSQKQVVK